MIFLFSEKYSILDFYIRFFPENNINNNNMGGNALKNTIISRISLEDYHVIKQDLQTILSKYMEIAFMYDVPNKMDFGDIDILCYYPSGNLRDLITELFHPHEIFVNGNVTSFAYFYPQKHHYYQIDLIHTHSENFACHQFYLSYGDLGNILGKITKRYDIHFGIQGLFVKLTEYNGKQVILSKDPQEICMYLGLNYSTWLSFQQSNNIEDIYNCIICWKLFHKTIFRDLNKKDRRHMNDRKMYHEFVQYIEKLYDDGYEDNSYVEFCSLKTNAIQYFQKQHDVIDRIKEEYALLQQRREKFNGKLFMKYGVAKKDLGVVIHKFKTPWSDFDAWLDANDKETIEEKIRVFLS